MRFVVTSPVALCVAQAFLLAVAGAQPPSREPDLTRVPSNEAGPHLSLASGLFLPPEGGHLGFAISGAARYGVAVGRATVAPGVRVAAYFRSGLAAVAPLATTRVSTSMGLAIGTTSPYLFGGVGFGHLIERSHDGFAYQLGAGLNVAVGTRMSVGAEVTYLAITGSEFRALSFGPCMTLVL